MDDMIFESISTLGVDRVFRFAIHYEPRGGQVRLSDVPFPNGEYNAYFFDPQKGPAGSRKIRVREGTTNFRTPNFVDDYVVHILEVEAR